jgi:hypothetical protein
MRRVAERLAARGQHAAATHCLHVAREEAGHDTLALRDLTALALPTQEFVARLRPKSCLALVELFTRLADSDVPIAVLGYAYALERMSLFSTAESIAAIERLLPAGSRPPVACACTAPSRVMPGMWRSRVRSWSRWRRKIAARLPVRRVKPSACCAQRCATIPVTQRCVRCLMNLDGAWPSRLWPVNGRAGENNMDEQEQGRKISQLIAKCWADEAFKRKVLADPAATLREEGLELPADLSYVAHENTDKVFHLVIPAKPTELSDEDLRHVAGGIVNVADPPLVIACGTCRGGGGSVGTTCCGFF